MRILYICNGLAGGGAEKLLHDMLPILKQKVGFYCELLILYKDNEKYLESLINQGVQVNVLPLNCNTHLKRLHYIIQYIKTNSFDVVHGNLFPTIYYCSLAKKILNKEFPYLVMTEHSTDNRRRHIKLLRPLEKWIYKSFNAVIAITPATQKALMDWLEIKESNKFKIIYNGIPIQKYAYAKPYEKKEIFNNIQENDILLGMVGTFSKQKNHKCMVEVFSLLPSKYKLVFLGEGKLRNEIKELVDSYGLNERVRFLGFRKDIAEIIHTIDIVVIPSLWEGFSLVAVEAMACGRPVIASKVPGLSSIVGTCGLLADPADTGSFVRHIKSLEDKRLYTHYSHLSLKRANEFSIERMLENYISLYNDI